MSSAAVVIGALRIKSSKQCFQSKVTNTAYLIC